MIFCLSDDKRPFRGVVTGFTDCPGDLRYPFEIVCYLAGTVNGKESGWTIPWAGITDCLFVVVCPD
jgi:hypothetical protein